MRRVFPDSVSLGVFVCRCCVARKSSDRTANRVLRLLTGDLEPKTGPLFMRIYPDSGDAGDDAPEARVERGLSFVDFFMRRPITDPGPPYIYFVERPSPRRLGANRLA